jgi:lactoylglutathione lyase
LQANLGIVCTAAIDHAISFSLASESGGQVFELYPMTDDASATSATRIGFCVPDVDAAYAELVAAGGTSVAPPKDSPWGRRVVVADPDGHRVELTAG